MNIGWGDASIKPTRVLSDEDQLDGLPSGEARPVSTTHAISHLAISRKEGEGQLDGTVGAVV